MKKRVIFKFIFCGALVVALSFPCFATVVMTNQTKTTEYTENAIINKYSVSFYDSSFFIRLNFSDSTYRLIFTKPQGPIYPEKETVSINLSNNENSDFSTGRLGLGNKINIKFKIRFQTDTLSAQDVYYIYFYKNGVISDTKSYNLIEYGQSGELEYVFSTTSDDINGFYFRFITEFVGNYISIDISDIVIEEIDTKYLVEIQKKTQEDVADIKDKIDDIADTEDFVPDVDTLVPDHSFDDQIDDALDVTASIDSSAAAWWAQLWSTLFDSELFSLLSPIAVFGALLGVFL